MKEFISGVETQFSKRFIRKYQISLVLFIILIAFVVNTCRNNESRSENNFLKSLNLNLTLKILKILPTGNHGYGVIYGQVIKSNKPAVYNAIYDNKYTFCKINKSKVLFISDFEVMKVNDSVVINSSELKYWVYRNGVSPSQYNLTSTTDYFLYSDLHKNKYLEFSSYQN